MSYSEYFPLDADVGLIKRAPAQAAVVATAYIGTQLDLLAATGMEMTCVINIEAVDVSSANETYTFRIVGSNATDRSDGEILAVHQAGHAGTLTIETRSSAAGDRLVIPFRTEKNRTRYRYIDLHLIAAGTTPSITFGAYFTKGC
jgi:hypothetical protein